MKVLVTGFEPFGKEKINPAYEAVKLLPQKIAGASILKLEIPVVFDTAAKIVHETIQKEKPDLVICIGQAGGRNKITPEFVAINYKDASIPDNNGNQPLEQTIKRDGDTAYFTKLPIKAMVKEMQKENIPAAISYSAGTYVCNDVFYQLLYDIAKDFPHIKGGFIHVPYASQQVVNKPEMPALPLEIIAKGLTICIITALADC